MKAIEKVAFNLRVMLKHKYKLKDFAKKTGLGINTLHRILRAEDCRISTLEIIANSLKTDIKEFFK